MGSGFFAVVMWCLQGRSREVDCNQDTVPLVYFAMNDSENDKILSNVCRLNMATPRALSARSTKQIEQ